MTVDIESIPDTGLRISNIQYQNAVGSDVLRATATDENGFEISQLFQINQTPIIFRLPPGTYSFALRKEYIFTFLFVLDVQERNQTPLLAPLFIDNTITNPNIFPVNSVIRIIDNFGLDLAGRNFEVLSYDNFFRNNLNYIRQFIDPEDLGNLTLERLNRARITLDSDYQTHLNDFTYLEEDVIVAIVNQDPENPTEQARNAENKYNAVGGSQNNPVIVSYPSSSFVFSQFSIFDLSNGKTIATVRQRTRGGVVRADISAILKSYFFNDENIFYSDVPENAQIIVNTNIFKSFNTSDDNQERFVVNAALDAVNGDYSDYVIFESTVFESTPPDVIPLDLVSPNIFSFFLSQNSGLGSVSYTVQASDNRIISKIFIQINGGDLVEEQNFVPAKNITFSSLIEADRLTVGLNNITIYVEDAQGNQAIETRQYTKQQDIEAPTISFSEDDLLYVNNNFSLIAQATDNVGVTKFSYKFGNDPEVILYEGVANTNVQATVNINIATYGEGLNELLFIAEDERLNRRETPFNFIKDTVAPVVLLVQNDSPTENDFANITIRVNEVNPLRSLSFVQNPVINQDINISINNLQIGNNTITIQAEDVAGNIGSLDVTIIRNEIRIQGIVDPFFLGNVPEDTSVGIPYYGVVLKSNTNPNLFILTKGEEDFSLINLLNSGAFQQNANFFIFNGISAIYSMFKVSDDDYYISGFNMGLSNRALARINSLGTVVNQAIKTSGEEYRAITKIRHLNNDIIVYAELLNGRANILTTSLDLSSSNISTFNSLIFRGNSTGERSSIDVYNRTFIKGIYQYPANHPTRPNQLIIWGNFNFLESQPSNIDAFCVARFSETGQFIDAINDRNIIPSWSGVTALAVQQNGKILIGLNNPANQSGTVQTVTGSNDLARLLIRLNDDFTLDSSFILNFGANGVHLGSNASLSTRQQRNITKIHVLNSGKIIVSGFFAGIQQDARGLRGICRLNSDGSLDNNRIFSGPIDTRGFTEDVRIEDFAIDSDNNIYILPYFKFAGSIGDSTATNYFINNKICLKLS